MLATSGRETEAAHRSPLDEVVRRAGVEEGEEVRALDGDRQQHGVRWLDTSNGVEGLHKGVSRA